MALHEEVNDKSIALGARVGKLTAEEIRKAIDKMLADLNGGGKSKNITKTDKTPKLKRGKQTLKQLSEHNAGLSSIELKDPELRLLYRTMKQNGVDFAPAKDGKGKYTLFFKGRDADALTRAFNQYTTKVVSRAKKQSIGKDLSAAKQAAKGLNAGRDKVKNRDKGARDI
jgi:triphosphoribosyl-dephospho-CoA synthetase